MSTTTLRPVEPEERKKLAKVSKAATDKTTERDRLICRTYLAGSSMREIGRVVDMGHSAVRYILMRDGAYDPNLENPAWDRESKAQLRQRLAREYEARHG